MARTAALEVPNGVPVQPFWRVSGVNRLAFLANEAPSSEVEHCASANVVSACTVTTPLGWMSRRPPPWAAAHRSTGTETAAAGRNAFGKVKAIGLVPVVDI